MSINFFSKKVYDEDLCFIRDLSEIGSIIASVTSTPVMNKIILGIIKKHNLVSKLEELNDNGHYIVQDSYPSNRAKRLERASDMMHIIKSLPITSNEKSMVTYKIISCIQKMGFSHEEKVLLVKENLVNLTGNKEIDNYMINEYVSLM